MKKWRAGLLTGLLGIAPWAQAAVTNVHVSGVTATQAVLSYHAPTAEACAVQVSLSATYAPVAFDVDESKFAGSSLDSREGSATPADQERVFVVGKRTAEMAADGKRYSRALQAATTYYFRVKCGSDTAPGTFTTDTIPFGSTYGELPPADRDNPGQYAWPTFDNTPRSQLPHYVSNEAHVDPSTGALVRRVVLPDDSDSASGSVWSASGSGYQCSPNTIADGQGVQGRYCIIPFPGGTPYLYWISEAGEARFIAGLIFWGYGSYWSQQTGCQSSYPSFDENDPTALYCVVKSTLVKVQINYPSIAPRARSQGAYLQACGSAPCWKFTVLGSDVANPHTDITSRVAAFDSSFPGFGCSLVTRQSHYLVIQCFSGSQDSLAWMALWDLNKNAASENPIVAATDAYARYPRRWCYTHSVGPVTGSPNLLSVTGHDVSSASTADPGRGPWNSMYVSGDLSQSLQACPANTVDSSAAGQAKCSTVTVDGEPCDPTPAASETSRCQTPGRTGDFYLQSAAPGDVMMIFDSNGNQEKARLLVKDGNTWTVQRGYYATAVRNWNGAQSVGFSMLCQCWYLENHLWSTAGWWWDFAADPHGTTAMLDPYAGSHGSSSIDVTVQDAGAGPDDCKGVPVNGLCYNVRTQVTNLESLKKAYGVSGHNSFAGQYGQGYLNGVESHISAIDGTATWLDARPYFSSAPPGNDVNTAFSPVSGTLYKATRTLNGSVIPATSTIRRKTLATLASCSTSPLVDVSGPASSITGGAGDAYKYCIPQKAGECVPGSSVGDVYVNCPIATIMQCSGNNADKDICIDSAGSNSGAISQYWFNGNDAYGRYQRVLSLGFQGYRQYGYYWNAKYTSKNANWVLAPVTGKTVPGRTEVVAISVPRIPNVDSINRATFVPVLVTLKPPPGLAVDNTLVEFGYAENGHAAHFYCTSRQETCVANSATVNASAPFFYSSTETYAGASCANGCTIAIPAIPQRVVYYRWKYRSAANDVIATGPMQVAVVR